MLSEFYRQLKEVPEYFMALKGALAVLAMGLPIYAGLRYFAFRRRLVISVGVTLNFVGVFVLFAGLAFMLASPLASHLPGAAVTAYLFITCITAALGIVSLVDVFFLRHYLSHVKQIYISPPLRTVINLGVFSIALLPILRFILHVQPVAVIAIPTIATAAVGLALQDTLKAFIAGIGLGHIVRIGEWINFQDKEGRVVDITWSRTCIDTADGQRVYIPNALLQANVILNYRGAVPPSFRTLKVVGPYEIPPEQMKSLLQRNAQEAKGVLSTPAPQVWITEFTDAGIVYTVLFGVKDYTVRLNTQDEVATRIWHGLKSEGIQIPGPKRFVQLMHEKEEALKDNR